MVGVIEKRSGRTAPSAPLGWESCSTRFDVSLSAARPEYDTEVRQDDDMRTLCMSISRSMCISFSSTRGAAYTTACTASAIDASGVSPLYISSSC